MTSLQGKVALVTGGSRGAGRGIALELAKAGAYVYITGRNAGTPQEAQARTLEGVLAEIRRSGGDGAVIRCDHTNDSETEAAIRQISAEQGRLDILINNVWGGNNLPIWNNPFWELPTEHWDNMFNSGVRAQLMTNYYAIPLMRSEGAGKGKLIVHTTFWDEYKYTGNFYYDLSKNALVRMAYGLSLELAVDGIAVIPLSPGWMRTEVVLDDFHTDEEHWQEVTELQTTESTAYVGRAVAALAADPEVISMTGTPQKVGELARKYGFTDIDGRQVPAFRIS
ncbi:SDR family NAD(P)-dependent oxidoreductase [Paenibacillus sp. FSL R7-0204]|uniref:SDR family NAD(P)-dependent oxidoreductase n=1 Tax=Paenibacillus sp. FSL R7-0204 TaxID=2921675 RepID=UPI0030F9C92A